MYSPGDSGRSTSIALDDSEYPCICFSAGNGVYYVYQDGSGWNDIEHVGGGGEPEMVLDADYYPHVAYSHYNVDAGEQYLKYAYKDGSGWYSEIVLDTGHSVNYPSLALDSNGYPHILYYYLEDPAYENKLKYAYKDGSGWHVETVNDENGACYISLEIDSSGYPHAAFHYWGYSSLKYIYRDGSGWHSETVEEYTDYDIGVGMYPSLVLDTAGNPHISYTYYNDDEGDEDLKYARFSP